MHACVYVCACVLVYVCACVLVCVCVCACMCVCMRVLEVMRKMLMKHCNVFIYLVGFTVLWVVYIFC